MPFTIDSVIWYKVDGTKDQANLPCSWNQFTAAGKGIKRCKKTMTKSGTLLVWATVNGQVESRSAQVSVLPCLVGDTVRDDARIRRMIALAWAGSNAFGPVPQRVERVGARVRRHDGTILDTNFGVLPGANNCRAWDPALWSPVPAVSPIGTILLLWHTHVFLPPPPYTDPTPNCSQLPLGPGQLTFAGPGLSAADSGQPVSQLVVDKKNSYYSADGLLDPPLVVTAPRTVCDILGYN